MERAVALRTSVETTDTYRKRYSRFLDVRIEESLTPMENCTCGSTG